MMNLIAVATTTGHRSAVLNGIGAIAINSRTPSRIRSRSLIIIRTTNCFDEA